MSPNEFYSMKGLSDNHDVLKVDSYSSGRRGGGGRGTVYASAASDYETGYKNHCFPVEEGIFCLRLTLENRAVLLSSTPRYSPPSSNALQSKNLMQADNKQMRDNKMSTTIFSLLSGTGSESHFFFVLNRSSLRLRHNRLIYQQNRNVS